MWQLRLLDAGEHDGDDGGSGQYRTQHIHGGALNRRGNHNRGEHEGHVEYHRVHRQNAAAVLIAAAGIEPALHHHQQAVITEAKYHPKHNQGNFILHHHMQQDAYGDEGSKQGERADVSHFGHPTLRDDATEQGAQIKTRVNQADFFRADARIGQFNIGKKDEQAHACEQQCNSREE